MMKTITPKNRLKKSSGSPTKGATMTSHYASPALKRTADNRTNNSATPKSKSTKRG